MVIGILVDQAVGLFLGQKFIPLIGLKVIPDPELLAIRM